MLPTKMFTCVLSRLLGESMQDTNAEGYTGRRGGATLAIAIHCA